jgi:valyl-tRNA synthetase
MLEGQYDSKKVEDKIYKLWEESGFFNPDKLPNRHKKTFSIVLPPPNVTGVLHMGSALMLAMPPEY